jgi:hypothetical protein
MDGSDFVLAVLSALALAAILIHNAVTNRRYDILSNQLRDMRRELNRHIRFEEAHATTEEMDIRDERHNTP